MNLFELFANNDTNYNEYENLSVLNDGSKTYTIKELKNLVSPIAERLFENNNKNVLIISSSNFDFVINFLAAVFAKKEIFLLSDSKKIDSIDFDCIVLDETKNTPKCCNGFKYEEPDFENTFVTLFTSGSSGTPKRIKKSFKNIINEAQDITAEFGEFLNLAQHQVTTSTTAHHMFGLTCWAFLAFCDCKKFILNTQEIIYPDRAEIADSVFISTPSFLEKFKKHEVSLKEPPSLILTAGDKLKAETYDYFEQNKTPLAEIYGATEVGVVGYKLSKDDEYFHCFKSVEAGTDESSQIVVSSTYFMEKTAVIGDIIEREDNKKFRLKCRNDRIVKIQEKRVSAQEIENHLCSCDFIETAYCFKYGEKLACAAVLTEAGKDIYIESRLNLIKKLKNSLKEKSEIIPQRWRFLPEIPKTKTGKIYKDKIMEIFDTNISLPLVLDMKKSENEAEYEIVFSKSCNFFDGHFKGFPILPGVVQLYFAHKFACESFDRIVLTTPVKKIKFSHLIRPDEKLKLSLKLNGGKINYSYTKNNTVCSSGVFETEE